MEERLPDAEAARKRAFADCVLPEVEVLLRVALTLTAQPADAEDLVRDTLLRAYRTVDRFDGRHPRAWLLTLMRRAELNRQATPDPGRAPESLVPGEAFNEVVAAALTALPLDHRQVVRLVDIDGLSYAEAAALLGVPEGTLMSRLHRARKRIRIRLRAAGLVPRRGGR